MIIPFEQLNSETLNSIIESYVLTEGTDYGEQEKSLQEKVHDVKAQLKAGNVVVVYSELHETVNLLPKEQFDSQRYEEEQEQNYPQ
ncbi:MAG: hypothetical protein ACI9FJ_001414 [Alteromonadaceae bacterium]|jgi:uncharacterized protein YheU (UPF0270 family)